MVAVFHSYIETVIVWLLGNVGVGLRKLGIPEARLRVNLCGVLSFLPPHTMVEITGMYPV